MKMRVLGIQMQDYVSKKSNQPVKGVSLYCAFKDPQVDGEAVDNVFISERLDCYRSLCHVKPGDRVNVEYGRRGFIVDAEILSPTSGPEKGK